MKAHKHESQMREDTRLALLEQSICHINETLIEIKADIKSGLHDLRSLRIDISKIEDGLRSDINKIEERSWSQFKWLLAFIITLCGSPLLIGLIKILKQLTIWN